MFGNLGPDIMVTGDKGPTSEAPDVHKSFGHLPFLQLKTSTHLIIPQWSTSSIYGLVTAMLAAIIASIGYEFLNEYCRHLNNRYTRKQHGSKCCGTEIFSCCEKFFLSILVIVRVIIGYFMMLCVMTMNIWLLVSVTVGAGIGYSIGKPVIANIFVDTFSPYEYPVARLKTDEDDDDEFVGNVTARSHSWRYRIPSKRLIESTGKRLMESTLSDRGGNSSNRLSGDYSRHKLQPNHTDNNALTVIPVRESKASAIARHISDIKDEDDIVFLRDRTDNGPDTRTYFSQTLTPPQSRFKSTSLVINESLRSDGSQSPRQNKTNSHTSGRTSVSPKTSGRFQPISKVIIHEQTATDKV